MKCGIDIIDVKRIEKLIKNVDIISLFSQYEIDYAEKYKNKAVHLAGFFSVKEAVSKALGVGLLKLGNISCINVFHDENGKPIVSLNGEYKQIFINSNFKEIDISISHTETYACAICIIN